MQNCVHLSPADALASGLSGPVVLPDGVRQFSGLWDETDALPPAWADFEVPYELRNAPPIRQRQFRAGRYCAARALGALEPDLAMEPLRRGASGAPVWPVGITGSITHTGGYTSAAVARTADFTAIGIDTETIMSASQARNVSLSVAWAYELVQARHAGCSHLEALTLVFSAKESIFKCLSGSAGFFDFRDVRIVEVDGSAGTFAARVMRTLSARLPAGTVLHGRFAIEAPWVHTGVAREATV